MSSTTSKLDRVSELRMRMGFPADAGFWMRFLLILALPPILFWRRKVGSRIVSLFRLLTMSALMLLWGAVVCVILAFGDWDRLPTLFAAVCAAEAGITMIGTAHRIVRWIMYQKGEKLSTRSPGISHFSRAIPNANAERYLDPSLTVAAGVLLCLPMLPMEFHAPGSWLVLSGGALFAVESYMHGIQLDQLDGLLKAEAHEQVTERFYKHMGEPASASSGGTTVATGLGSDLQASIARREQRRAKTTATTEARLPDAPTQEPDAASNLDSEPATIKAATFRAATQELFERNEPSREDRSPDAAPQKVARPASTDNEKADRERAKRNKMGAAIGLAVAVGTIVAPSFKAAFTSIASPRTAAKIEAIDATLIYERAERFYSGIGGVDEDKAFAATLYLAGATLGHAPAQLKLGIMYEQGEGGLEKDATAAVRLYRRAADQGLAKAQTYLADMYMVGQGIEADPRAAAIWYQKAAEQRDPSAQYSLAKLYLSGSGGLAVDKARGQALMVSAAKLGSVEARQYIDAIGK